jgi:DNA polymerase I-like protein with 3'-5' exonuclease and polymerase domains
LPPKLFHFRVNYLVQGSAADITKQAMINAHRAGFRGDNSLILSVHDELMGEVERPFVLDRMETLRQAMESVPLDAKLLSDGKSSDESWEAMTKYEDVLSEAA